MQSQHLLEVLFRFLSSEEKLIVEYLINNGGKANQADISRLPNMGRVKAYRTLQRMEGKQIVNIEAHGKIRRVQLLEDLVGILKERER